MYLVYSRGPFKIDTTYFVLREELRLIFSTVHFFIYSIQMVTVSKNHEFKWFVIYYGFLIIAVKVDGSGEPRFTAVLFTVGSGSVCTQQ